MLQLMGSPLKDHHRYRVLAVDEVSDDETVFYPALARYYELQRASSAEDALRKLSHSKPDIILLDVRLKGMNGIDLCKYL